MKLLFCPECHDIIKLQKYTRTCQCEKSGGYYLENGDYAKFFGQAIPIAISNLSFEQAIRSRSNKDKSESFTGFVFPKKHPHIFYYKK